MPPRGLSDIPETETRERLSRYLDCLLQWSRKINLTGAETRAAAFETLIAPVLGGEAFLRGHVVDVGSGNGSPGLILAAMRPDLMFSLLEPRAKRWAFLREAARAMGLNNTEARRERSEDYKGGAADTLTMRAVGLTPIQVRPLLASGGCVLVFGGPDLPGAETLRLPGGARLQRCCFT